MEWKIISTDTFSKQFQKHKIIESLIMKDLIFINSVNNSIISR